MIHGDRPPQGGGAGSAAEQGRFVYPVMSRRSGGLSLGINLFPGAKVCSFDCPYCEIFAPPQQASEGVAPGPVSTAALEAELAEFLDRRWNEVWAPEPIRDLCISGNGEPTLSPSLGAALAVCDRARRSRPELLGSAKLVLITNSTGFLDLGTRGLLSAAVDEYGLEIWAKLDAGGEELFRIMSGSSCPLARIVDGLAAFASMRPILIQSMFCAVRDRIPSERDAQELGALLASLAAQGALIRCVQVYTFSRPTPHGGCAAVDDTSLSHLAGIVARCSGLPVRVFGSRGAPGAGGAACSGSGR